MKRLIQSDKVKYGLMLVHALCTFLWSGRVFKNVGVIAIGSKAMNQVISDRMEQCLAHVISEGIALLLVWLFWTITFHVLRKFRKSYLFFGLLYVIGAVVLVLAWPGVFEVSMDNVITYSSAVRLTPDYWHCAYSSYAYAGCLLFFPLDFMILIVQWSFFTFGLAYAFYRLERIAPRLRWLVFGVLLLPNTILVIRDSYRIYQYLTIVLIYVTLICCDVLEKRERKGIEYLWIAALGAFLSVWRTECILFCPVFFLAHVLCTQKGNAWKKVRPVLTFAVLFLLILTPQKLGEIKYYGKDYQIMNSLYPLQAFMKSRETNLSYAGAQKDLDAISMVVPLAYVKEYGIGGYHRYNYNVLGNKDLNQSLATSKDASAYVRAYYSIWLHNPKNVARLVWDNLLYAFSIRHVYFKNVPIPKEEHVELEPAGMEMWEDAAKDLHENGHTIRLGELTSRLGITEKLIKVHETYSDFVFARHGNLYAFFVFCICNLVMFVIGAIRYLRKKDLGSFAFGLIGLAMFGEYLGLLLLAPVPNLVYFLISDYVSVAYLFYALLFYLGRKRKASDGKIKEHE